MAEDLGEEDIVGLVFGFELVATDGAVGASEVAGFPPGSFRGAEGVGDVLGELRAGGGVDGLGGREAFEGPELSECADNVLGVSEDGDGIWFETGYRELGGF